MSYQTTIPIHNAGSTTERYFTLSVVCLLVKCTRRQHIGNPQKNIKIVVFRLGWKRIERSILQLVLLKQKEVELLFVRHGGVN